MDVQNRVVPNEEQIKGFFEPAPEGPIYMVNLLKFKPQAEYEDGRSSDLMGEAAYGIYADAVHRAAGLAGQLNIETVGAGGTWIEPPEKGATNE